MPPPDREPSSRPRPEPFSGEIVARLPHAPPALLVTSARMGPGGGSCEGVRTTGGSDPAANSYGFFPSSLLVELMAQTAGLILPQESRRAYVAGIRDLRLHRGARAGEAIRVRATLQRTMGSLFMFRCRADVSGRLLASGSITLRAF